MGIEQIVWVNELLGLDGVLVGHVFLVRAIGGLFAGPELVESHPTR
jgi:hypothetical protein